MSWKSAIVGSALALGSQTALADKPLPCPTVGPLQDIASVVQGDTRQKIENRLRAIDTEKKHQVVVITVKNLEEYGYGSIEQMANALGKECKVGYRGENTGIVVLYTQVPSRYRIENAGTERYITDIQSGRILTHSKSEGVCKKGDVSCRLDDITGEIDILIRREFPDNQAVAKIDTKITAHDESQSSQDMSELLGTLSIGAVIIVVLGGGAFGVTTGVGAINRRNRRKEIKKEILELSIHIQTEKQKYPAWFQDQHIRRSELAIEKINQYSDDQIDRILSSDRMKREIETSMSTIRASIESWQIELSSVQSKLNKETDQFNARKGQISEKNTRLLAEGFVFPSLEIPSVRLSENPLDSLSRIEEGLRTVSEIEELLSEIPRLYSSAKGFDTTLQSKLRGLQIENAALSAEYQSIFRKVPTIDLVGIIQGAMRIVTQFQKAYEKKDINLIRSLTKKGDTILVPLHDTNRIMRKGINWYASIPAEIARREKQLLAVHPNSQYSKDASAHAQKTGERDFLNYDLSHTLSTLQGILGMIKNLHSQKQDLDTITVEFLNFDREFSKTQEYIGLGGVLTAMIAAEIAQTMRKKREAQEKEEVEQRRRRREQDEEDNARKRDDDSGSPFISSSSSNWTSGGGEGFSGGGASSDDSGSDD